MYSTTIPFNVNNYKNIIIRNLKVSYSAWYNVNAMSTDAEVYCSRIMESKQST